MSELVLGSMYAPKDHVITIVSHRAIKLEVSITTPNNTAGATISHEDACKLRDFLNKVLGEQAPEPSKPVKAPQLILAWKHPENGHRFSLVSNEAEATNGAVSLKRGLPDFPIWLAQITKQYVQPNPTYEWKDI